MTLSVIPRKTRFELSSAGLSNRCQVSLNNEGSSRKKQKIFTLSVILPNESFTGCTFFKIVLYSLYYC